MNLLTATAYSPGNKARAVNDNGNVVIVQSRWSDVETSWFHIWIVRRGVADYEGDLDNCDDLQMLFSVNPNANYWHSI